MKIERKNKPTMLCFHEIEEGTVFIARDGDICMKTNYGYIQDKICTKECNAVFLQTGKLTLFGKDDFISLPISAKLVIE